MARAETSAACCWQALSGKHGAELGLAEAAAQAPSPGRGLGCGHALAQQLLQEHAAAQTVACASAATIAVTATAGASSSGISIAATATIACVTRCIRAAAAVIAAAEAIALRATATVAFGEWRTGDEGVAGEDRVADGEAAREAGRVDCKRGGGVAWRRGAGGVEGVWPAGFLGGVLVQEWSGLLKTSGAFLTKDRPVESVTGETYGQFNCLALLPRGGATPLSRVVRRLLCWGRNLMCPEGRGRRDE